MAPRLINKLCKTILGITGGAFFTTSICSGTAAASTYGCTVFVNDQQVTQGVFDTQSGRTSNFLAPNGTAYGQIEVRANSDGALRLVVVACAADYHCGYALYEVGAADPEVSLMTGQRQGVTMSCLLH